MGLMPIDKDSVMKDPYFYTIMQRQKGTRSLVLNNQIECLDTSKKVLQLIKEELGESE